MTDKVEQVLAKIKERLNHLNGLHGDFPNGQQHELILMRNFINSLQEEQELKGIEKEVAEDTVARIDRKRIPIELNGEIKAKFRNEFNTMWQIIQIDMFANVAKHIIERVCLHFAAWGAYYLKDYVGMNDEEKGKMDLLQEEPYEISSIKVRDKVEGKLREMLDKKEEPVSEELEKVALEYATHYDKNWSEVKDGYIAENEVEAFKAGANWKREQIAKENMLLPFKDYDNLMESINKRKKEGYEAGYRQGLVDSKSE